MKIYPFLWFMNKFFYWLLLKSFVILILNLFSLRYSNQKFANVRRYYELYCQALHVFRKTQINLIRCTYDISSFCTGRDRTYWHEITWNVILLISKYHRHNVLDVVLFATDASMVCEVFQTQLPVNSNWSYKVTS